MTAPRVSVSLGWTRNMGNFESLRVDIGVSADARDGESTADAFTRVYSFVEKTLMEKVQETEAEVKTATDAARD